MTTTVDLEGAWEISPQVALRPEAFGALAYHFGNRRLTFLKHPDLVAVLTSLHECSTPEEALARAHVGPAMRPAVLAALRNLAATDMIRPRAAQGSDADVA